MGNLIEQITCKVCSNNLNPENEEEQKENNFESSEITTESRTILPQKIIDIKFESITI